MEIKKKSLRVENKKIETPKKDKSETIKPK